ncbi:MAG: DUF4876 domain-containing protein [Niabella sp.]
MSMKTATFLSFLFLSLISVIEADAQGTKGFVIKQVYYAGSNSKTAAGISDQFIEIYNNSNKTLYADGLYVSFITGSRIMPGTKLSKDGAASVKDYAVREDGTFDWTQSYGMPDNIRANDDYIYASTVYRVPGNGTSHPVKAGESFVIAQSAKNYKEPFTRFNGQKVTPTQPDSTVDLSHADFEVNMLQVDENARDHDNPDVVDMDIVRKDVRVDMLMDWNGKEAIVIYRYPGDINQLPTYTTPLKGKVESTNPVHLMFPFMQLPIKYVLDAVEIQPGDGTKGPKRLPESLDKGAAGTDVVTNSGRSVIRKTLKKQRGRIILQDTDNSSNDFIGIKAEPKTFKN